MDEYDVFHEEDRDDDATQPDIEAERAAIKALMNTVGGRSFMWRCLQSCYTFENIYDKDVVNHAMRAGLRSHGVWLDKELHDVTPNDYYLMLREHR